MTYTTTNLITDAFFLSEIASKEFETVSGVQQSDGLVLLNDVLGDSEADVAIIPYESTSTFTAVVGQEQYQIPNLVLIDTLTFLKDNVRFSLMEDKRNNYFGAPRVESINSLPTEYNFERGFDGGTISLYFLPDEPYVFTLHGTFKLAEVALGQDLELTISRFFRTYLKYALTQRICDFYNFPTPPGVERRLNYYISIIKKNSRVLDLRMQKSSTLTKRSAGGWAYVNIGRGWSTNGRF